MKSVASKIWLHFKSIVFFVYIACSCFVRHISIYVYPCFLWAISKVIARACIILFRLQNCLNLNIRLILIKYWNDNRLTDTVGFARVINGPIKTICSWSGTKSNWKSWRQNNADTWQVSPLLKFIVEKASKPLWSNCYWINTYLSIQGFCFCIIIFGVIMFIF